MPVKLRAQVEGLSIIATVVTAALPKDTIVAITSDMTVDKAGAGAKSVGRLFVPSRTANNQGTVETRFKERIEIKASGTVAANDDVKLAAPDGTTGENRVSTFVEGTDAEYKRFGRCWKGGADGATVEVLTY